MYSRDKIIDTFREIVNGSQELEPYVIIAQPRRVKEEVPAQNFRGEFTQDNQKQMISSWLHIDLLGFTHGFCDIFGEKVDVARNYLIERAIESKAKYLFFVGEDTVIPYDGFKKLHRTAEENPGCIVAGVYYIKISDAMIMCRKNDSIYIPNVDPGQILEAWQTGMDAMLIPIDILREMKEEEPELPFCCIGNEVDGRPIFIGEDNFFAHRIHKRGTRILVNTDVQCLHMDLATGKYTAHPSVNLDNYFTNIPITEPLTLEDKRFIDKRWVDRLPKGSNHKTAFDKIQQMIDNGEEIKLNMGCGPYRMEGYIGIDSMNSAADIQADITNLDLPKNCADEILASHILEHIHQHQAPSVLFNWYEILKENGKLILELPNLEELCRAFLDTEDDQEKFILTMCIYGAFADNQGNLSPHVWGYYPKVLSKLLEEIGFKHVEVLPQQGPHLGRNFRVEAVK